jgi:hypothetical protein
MNNEKAEELSRFCEEYTGEMHFGESVMCGDMIFGEVILCTKHQEDYDAHCTKDEEVKG